MTDIYDGMTRVSNHEKVLNPEKSVAHMRLQAYYLGSCHQENDLVCAYVFTVQKSINITKRWDGK